MLCLHRQVLLVFIWDVELTYQLAPGSPYISVPRLESVRHSWVHSALLGTWLESVSQKNGHRDDYTNPWCVKVTETCELLHTLYWLSGPLQHLLSLNKVVFLFLYRYFFLRRFKKKLLLSCKVSILAWKSKYRNKD